MTKLLTSGNPQIAKGDGDAPVQAYVAAMPGLKRAVGERLDALVVDTLPEVMKAVRWNTPLYGVAGGGFFLDFNCTTRYVKVAFFRGAALDPEPPVGSRDPNTRYLHLYEDGIDAAQFTAWVRQAGMGAGAVTVALDAA